MVPATVYREYTVLLHTEPNLWRVTDPDNRFGAQAAAFLPNPVIEIPEVDTEGAVAADLTIDFWSGHNGTQGKRIRFNGKPWIPLPERLEGTRGFVGDYLAQYNLTVSVPLGHLVAGTNLLRGTCDDNTWGWGQWGWYSATLRIYLNPEGRGAPARVTRLDGTAEDSSIGFRLDSGGSNHIGSVDYLAFYEGVDEDGDGLYTDWHGMYRLGAWTGHIGSAEDADEAITWDLSWIPQQKDPVSVIARYRADDGLWRVTEPLEGILLPEQAEPVFLYRPRNVPVTFWVRNGGMQSCVVRLPEDYNPDEVVEARLFIRAWNIENNEQGHTPMRINHEPWMDSITGPGHSFHMEAYPVDPLSFRAGDNLVTFRSETHHHGCELLWPGPHLLLKQRR